MADDREIPGRWKSSVKTWLVIKPSVQRLRREITPAERKLWSRIRGRQVAGFKFRRQMPVNRFVTDFYCSDARLLIEVDGLIHAQQVRENAVRQEFLESTGLRVIRFTNDQVLRNIDHVLSAIAAELQRQSVPAKGAGKGRVTFEPATVQRKQ